jgi:chromosome segregation ATPase|tara:strand:+ start:2610 stop:2786 length:177 start_codon:yes stop_codon:yes gene_type:complete
MEPQERILELEMQIEALTRQVNRKDKRIAYLEAEKEETAETVRGLIAKGNELIERLSE